MLHEIDKKDRCSQRLDDHKFVHMRHPLENVMANSTFNIVTP